MLLFTDFMRHLIANNTDLNQIRACRKTDKNGLENTDTRTNTRTTPEQKAILKYVS